MPDETGQEGPFTMVETAGDGGLDVALRGELDIAYADRVSARLTELAEAGTAVRLDLSDLDFIDSSGIAALVAARRLAKERTWSLTVLPELRPHIERVFTMTGITETLLENSDPVGS